jgi:hypothetical protein
MWLVPTTTSTVSWSLCLGGMGPQRIDRPRHPSVGFRRGARDTYAEYESPTLHRNQAWCMHVDTWQHTTPLHGNSPSPATEKTKLLDVLLERAARARSCRRAAEHGSGVMILATHPPTNHRGRNQRDISEISSGYQRDISEISARHQRDNDEPDRRQDGRPTRPPRHRHPRPRPRASPRGRSGTCRCTCRWRSCGRAARPGCHPPSAQAGRPSSSCPQPSAS